MTKKGKILLGIGCVSIGLVAAMIKAGNLDSGAEATIQKVCYNDAIRNIGNDRDTRKYCKCVSNIMMDNFSSNEVDALEQRNVGANLRNKFDVLYTGAVTVCNAGLTK